MPDRAEARLPRPKSTVHVLALGGAVLASAGLPAPAAGAASPRLDKTEKRVVRLINRNRMMFGLPKLRVSRPLTRSADSHSRDMARRRFFAHSSSNGQSFERRVRRFKRAVRLGENIAFVPRRRRGGRRAARQVVSMWINSPAHRDVLFSRGFRRIGVARRSGRLGESRVTVFTADFSSRR